MSDRGGRTRWRRALVGGGISATLLMAASACGSRTLALDQSIYGADDDDDLGGSSGSGAGGSSFAGTPSFAGSASTSGGGAGLNPGAAVGPCNTYCPSYASQCAERLDGQDCEASCQAEINGFGVRCQQLGIQALNCLRPFFTIGGRNCDAAVNGALQKCGKVVTDFQSCKGVTTPTPSMPMPTTPSDVTQCGSSGNASANSCQTTYLCPSGKFEVACTITADGGVAICGCLSPNGAMAGGTVPNSDPCTLAARSLCVP